MPGFLSLLSSMDTVFKTGRDFVGFLSDVKTFLGKGKPVYPLFQRQAAHHPTQRAIHHVVNIAIAIPHEKFSGHSTATATRTHEDNRLLSRDLANALWHCVQRDIDRACNMALFKFFDFAHINECIIGIGIVDKLFLKGGNIEVFVHESDPDTSEFA